MPAPSFVSSSPISGATGVAKNVSLSIVFDAAIDPTTVDEATVYLKNTELNQVVPSAVSVSSDGLTLTIVPETTMIPLSAYTIFVIGADVDSSNPVKSTTDDALAVSVRIAFQTGEDVATSETDIEGDLELPEEVTSVAGASTPLRVMSARPKHHSFGLDINLAQIAIRFNKDLDATSVTGNVSVSQMAFYEEEDLRAVETDLGEGEGSKHYFQFQTADETGLDPALFDDAGGYADVTGAYLLWNFTGALQKNVCIEMTIGADIADTEGITLGSDQLWFGCTEPYPKWVDLRSVRHQVGHDAASKVPDDFLGLRIWQNSMDLVQAMGWRVDLDEANTRYRQYIRCVTGLDLWEDLKVTAALAAGSTKRLGDLSIQYAATAGAVRPWAINRLMEECEELKRMTLGALSEKIAIGVRSSRDLWEPSRAYFRSRLWRGEMIYNAVLTPANVANTARQRLQTEFTDF